jgi:hypothetical protein
MQVQNSAAYRSIYWPGHCCLSVGRRQPCAYLVHWPTIAGLVVRGAAWALLCSDCSAGVRSATGRCRIVERSRPAPGC